MWQNIDIIKYYFNRHIFCFWSFPRIFQFQYEDLALRKRPNFKLLRAFNFVDGGTTLYFYADFSNNFEKYSLMV